MADITATGGQGIDLFEMPDLKNFMDTISVAASQKAAAHKQTLLTTQRESEAITDSAEAYNNDAVAALQDIHQIEAQGATARSMADSGNLFERIALIGDQMLTPQAYTRAGREGRMQEISQTLAVKGQIQGIAIDTAKARISEALSTEAVTTADADASLAKLTMQADALTMINQGLVAGQTLRMNNLATLDLPILQKALNGPVPPDGKIKINGMAYTPLELKEQSKKLETRGLLSMLSPAETDPDYVTKLRAHQALGLQTLSRDELLKIRADGFIMNDGTVVDSATWAEAYSRETAVQNEIIQSQIQSASIQNQLPGLLKDAQTMLDAGAKQITPGTPASMASTRFRAAMQTVATTVTADGSDASKAKAMVTLQSAQDTYIKEITAESKRQAGGDEKLAAIYTNRFLGLPPSEQQLGDFLVERFKDQKGFGEVLTDPQDARLLKTNADQEYFRLKQAQAQDVMGNNATLKDDELRAQAMRTAMIKTAKDKAVEAMNVIQPALSYRDDNPAKAAGLLPQQIQNKMRQAAIMANDDVKRQFGITDAQVEAIRSGRPQDAGMADGDIKAAAGQLNASAIFAEYDLFDAVRPGLGYDMQQWVAKTAPELAKAYSSKLTPEVQTLVGSAVIDEAMRFNDMYAAADETATRRGREMAVTMGVGAKRPENMWPVLLQINPILSDPQRETLYYDVILPVITQQRAIGANDDAVAAAAFDAVSNYKSDDKIVNAAVQTLQRELPGSLAQFNVMWDSAMAGIKFPGNPFGVTSNLDFSSRAPTLEHELRKSIPWLKLPVPPATKTSSNSKGYSTFAVEAQ